MTALGIIGIILAFALLMYMIMKGFNIYLTVFVCTLVVAVTSQMNVYEAYKVHFMTGFTTFFKNNYLIAKLQGLQWYLADMATRTEAARALVFEAACAADSGEPLSKLAAMCKYYASENAVWVTNKALQIHGGYGYMRDYPIERMYRDARIVPIYEGTSEIQKVVIARELLK